MGTETDLIKLYKPTVSEADWGEQVNANFDKLDTVLRNRLRLTQVVGGQYGITVSGGSQVFIFNLSGGPPSSGASVQLPQITASNDGRVLYFSVFTDNGGESSNVFTYSGAGDTYYEGNTAAYSISAGSSFAVVADNANGIWHVLNNDGFTLAP
jgi:hypothetical protein